MSLSKMVSDEASSTSSSSIPKWQVALMIGTPIVLGIGAYYYFREIEEEVDHEPKVSKSSKRGSGGKAGTKGSKEQSAKSVVSKPKTPKHPSLEAKERGNQFFKGKNYEKAMECYSEAIALCDPDKKEDRAIFYQNRAAAAEMLQLYSQVLEDCSKAIEDNNKYTKAYVRRCKAYKELGRMTDAITDITAACILQRFEVEETIRMTDSLLREVSKIKAKSFIRDRVPTLPSHQFIRQYFMSFVRDPLIREMDIKGSKDLVSLFEKKLKEAEGDGQTDPFILLLKGTSHLLMGDVKKAEEYLARSAKPFYPESPPTPRKEIFNGSNEKSISPEDEDADGLMVNPPTESIPQSEEVGAGDILHSMEKDDSPTDDTLTPDDGESINSVVLSNYTDIQVTSLVRLGTIRVNSSEPEDTSESYKEALAAFDQAIELDPSNADIYVHRAQVYIMMERVEDGKKDLEKCVSLCDDFPAALSQLHYVTFRLAAKSGFESQMDKAIKGFIDATTRFPQSSEVYSLYAQSLMEKGDYEGADENLLMAIKYDPTDANLYVHRAILKIQSDNGGKGAVKLLEKAVETDPKCQFAHEMYGSILVQNGSLKAGIESFKKALDCCQTETDAMHMFSLKDAAIGQISAANLLGLNIPT